MTIRAFTGPTKLTEDQVEWVEEQISELMEVPDEVRTGCADGLDTIAAQLQWFEYPSATHRLFVPSAYHNDKIVAYLKMSGRDHVEVIRCPRRTQRAAAYRVRNEYMVTGEAPPPERGAQIMRILSRATELQAFVFDAEFYRSGEWMTINIATRAGVSVNKHIIPKEV